MLQGSKSQGSSRPPDIERIVLNEKLIKIDNEKLMIVCDLIQASTHWEMQKLGALSSRLVPFFTNMKHGRMDIQMGLSASSLLSLDPAGNLLW